MGGWLGGEMKIPSAKVDVEVEAELGKCLYNACDLVEYALYIALNSSFINLNSVPCSSIFLYQVI